MRLAISTLLAVLLCQTAVTAQRVRLKDGRILQGKVLPISGIAESPVLFEDPESAPKSTPILVIDDNLRRVFVPKFFLAEVIDQLPEKQVVIKPWQNEAQVGSALASVGPSLGITPWDKFGRRIYEMQTRNGPLAVVQGITVLTPRYAKVEGLRGQPKSIVWDMRLATSSIPSDRLAEILETAVDQDDPQEWLRVVSFYLQAERYRDARLELQKIIERFPDRKELQDEVRQLRQLGARRIFKEIELRQAAGQHELVSNLLANFPADEVAGETLQQVREMISEYESESQRIKQTMEQLTAAVEELGDPDHRSLVQPTIEEIGATLSRNNVDRLAPFLQLVTDPQLTAEEKMALALSGWYLGGEDVDKKLSVALSLVKAHEAVRQYLREPLALERSKLIAEMRSMEGASVERVAKLIAHMNPPWDFPEEALQMGSCQLEAKGQTEHGNFRYLVQLPPEYDPYRRYPTIVALNGAYNSPEQELDFWTGSPKRDETGQIVGPPHGQAMRHGYITISIDWHKPQQYAYEYSLREHEAVLTCLRDACRRLSINTDRVYLTGHGIGGDAVWDVALSHPDLWAGVIPFVAKIDPVKKYVQHYLENSQHVPVYFVAGEKDGQKMSKNASVLDKCLLKRFDLTVVEFLGRGQEPFHDEILEAFAWMELPTHRRTGPPERFECNTMRPWDNFFWWVECHGFSSPVYPGDWPRRNARPTVVKGRKLNPTLLSAHTPSERTTLWFGPDLVDFSAPSLRVKLNGNKVPTPRPELAVLLEDVRTRADRQRPFWAKVDFP